MGSAFIFSTMSTAGSAGRYGVLSEATALGHHFLGAGDTHTHTHRVSIAPGFGVPSGNQGFAMGVEVEGGDQEGRSQGDRRDLGWGGVGGGGRTGPQRATPPHDATDPPHPLGVEESHVPHHGAAPVVADQDRLRDTLRGVGGGGTPTVSVPPRLHPPGGEGGSTSKSSPKAAPGSNEVREEVCLPPKQQRE